MCKHCSIIAQSLLFSASNERSRISLLKTAEHAVGIEFCNKYKNEFVGECFVLSNFFTYSHHILVWHPIEEVPIFWKEYLNNFSTYVTRYIPFNLCSCKRKALGVFICMYKYLKSPIWSRRMKIIMVKSGPKWQKMEHKV